MKIEFRLQKNIILVGIVLLLVADAVLTAYALRFSAGAPQQALAAHKAQVKLLRADVNRALAIQREMPRTKADCERFENSLLSGSFGYSALSAELTEIAKRSGLQVASVGFSPKELPSRNMAEIMLEVTVNGDYKGVVRFLNGLQRSKNYYIVDSLTLASGTGGDVSAAGLKVALHLRSYFKNAA